MPSLGEGHHALLRELSSFLEAAKGVVDTRILTTRPVGFV